MIWLSTDLKFKRLGCQLMCDSNDSGCHWFEIQVAWLSLDLRIKWLGGQLMCDSNDLVVH